MAEKRGGAQEQGLPDMLTRPPVFTGSDLPDSQAGQPVGLSLDALQGKEVGPATATYRFITAPGPADRATVHTQFSR